MKSKKALFSQSLTIIKRVFILIVLFSSVGTASALTNTELMNPYYKPDEEPCAPDTTISGAPTSAPKSIYMLGDSITSMSQTPLKNKMEAAGFNVVKINADPGRAIATDTVSPDGKGSSGYDAVNEDGNLDNSMYKNNLFLQADAAVIALGTNSGNEDLNVEIPKLVELIRKAKPGIPIYWVKLFYDAQTSVSRDERNSIIDTMTTRISSFYTIETVGQGIELKPADQTHPTAAGVEKFSQVVVDGLTRAPINPQGSVSPDGNPTHILTFPGIQDHKAAATAIENYIKSLAPTSPFASLGETIMKGALRSNVNPFLATAHLQIESGFGVSTARGWHNTTPASFNAFGRRASSTDQPHTTYTRDSGEVVLVYRWDSWEDSLYGEDDWFQAIRRNYLNPGSKYESHDFAKYISHYAPNSDGNRESEYIAKILGIIDQASVGVTVSGTVPIDPSGACLEEGDTGDRPITADGYAFPLQPQTQAIGGIKIGQTTTMHHDHTAAFDLFSTLEGADVYAIYDGTVDTVNTSFNNIPGCSSIQFKANDGFYYWYGHLAEVVVSEGQVVKANTKLSKIADSKRFNSSCWGGTPHLHIDRGCVIAGIPQRGGRDECRDPNFIPLLAFIYASLPK